MTAMEGRSTHGNVMVTYERSMTIKKHTGSFQFSAFNRIYVHTVLTPCSTTHSKKAHLNTKPAIFLTNTTFGGQHITAELVDRAAVLVCGAFVFFL